MSLLRAGSFLVLASARNRVRQAVRKLREPRYLVGAAAMALYLYSVAFRTSSPQRGGGSEAARLALHGELWRLVLEMGITAIGAVALWATWTLGRDRLSFSFNEAEATWLLSGPLSRRQVVRYKVAVGLLRTMLSALLATVFFRRGLSAAVNLTLIPLLLGTSLGFGMLWLHSAFASLVRVGWLHAGTAASRRSTVGVALLACYCAVGALTVREVGVPPVVGLVNQSVPLAEGVRWLRAYAHAPVTQVVLLPARAFFGTVRAASVAEGFHSLSVLAALFALLLAAVLLLDVPVEEAALASAERRARLDTRRRRRGLAMPKLSGAPRLRAGGRPEWALTWKNLIALRRVYGAGLGISLVPIAIGAGFMGLGLFHRAPLENWRLLAALVAVAAAAFTGLFGPLRFRTDLRSDLRRLDVLRTLPLSGLQVVRGELLAPALLLGASEVALLALALGLSSGATVPRFPFLERLCWTAGAMVLLPVATAGLLVVQNAVALVFPSLLVEDEDRAPRGIEATGTRLVNLGASLLLLLGGFMPAAVVGLAAGALAGVLGLGPLASTLGCVAVAAVLAVEIAFALRWMGLGLERLDPTTA